MKIISNVRTDKERTSINLFLLRFSLEAGYILKRNIKKHKKNYIPMEKLFEKFDRDSLYYFRSLVQTQEENEYSEGKDKNTAALENIFIGITSLVIVLIGVLIYVTTKTRSRNRFKLLDNSGREELRLSIKNQEDGRKLISSNTLC